MRNLRGRIGFTRIVSLQQLQTLLVDPGQIRTDGAFVHRAVEGVFRGEEGVRGTVVAVNAIHHAAFALGHVCP